MVSHVRRVDPPLTRCLSPSLYEVVGAGRITVSTPSHLQLVHTQVWSRILEGGKDGETEGLHLTIIN